MHNFWDRLRYKIANFMVGRYGSDQLSRFMMGLALAMVVLNIIFRTRTSIFYWLVWVLLILTYFRMFSRNIQKRYNENTRFLELKDRLFGRRGSSGTSYGSSYSGYSGNASYAGGDPDKKVYSCPGCGQKVRVPKGRGRIRITCPKCGREFVKRT